MTSDRELLQMALDALDAGIKISPDSELHERFRARLAQQEPEPVAWMAKTNRIYKSRMDAIANGEQLLNPLYAAPPQREWQGLTDNEIDQYYFFKNGDVLPGEAGEIGRDYRKFARAIEQALKEKNRA